MTMLSLMHRITTVRKAVRLHYNCFMGISDLVNGYSDGRYMDILDPTSDISVGQVGQYTSISKTLQFLSPEPRGYCFRFVCLSVCLSVRTGRFLRHFVRLTPPSVSNAQKRNLYHMKAHNE